MTYNQVAIYKYGSQAQAGELIFHSARTSLILESVD
jgi:hypothetical protein